MARIYPLFSSSKGNSIYIGTKNEGILIDDGVSFGRLKHALEINGLSTDIIKAVFITHEHSDHIKGLAVLTKKIKAPVFARGLTLEYLNGIGTVNGGCHEFKSGEEVCGMRVECFDTPHDARSSCGYKVTFKDGASAAVCTDLGHVTEEIEAALRGTRCVLLEANYDVEMLRSGSYPYYLKARIFGGNGHLSNDDSGRFAARLVESGTEKIILGHLSQENNRPEIAESTVASHLNGFRRNIDYILCAAPPETSGGFTAI